MYNPRWRTAVRVTSPDIVNTIIIIPDHPFKSLPKERERKLNRRTKANQKLKILKTINPITINPITIRQENRKTSTNQNEQKIST